MDILTLRCCPITYCCGFYHILTTTDQLSEAIMPCICHYEEQRRQKDKKLKELKEKGPAES